MNQLDRNTLRNALNDDGKRIPNSSWDLTAALEPLGPDDPFASFFDLNTFEAKWIFDAPSKPFSDVEKELLILRLLMTHLQARWLRPVGSNENICVIIYLSLNKLQI